MSETPEPKRDTYVPPVVDQSKDFDFGWQDVILGFLTFPLLIFTLQYAVSGAERIVATPGARLKLYGVLLTIEVLIALGIWLVFIR